MVDIAVVSGSKSDQAIVDRVAGRLAESGASFEHKILSAHRNPAELEEYVKKPMPESSLPSPASPRPFREPSPLKRRVRS